MITIHVFADSREPDWVDHKQILCDVSLLDGQLQRLAMHDWHYPSLVVWKTPGDTKWSYWHLTKGAGEAWLMEQGLGEEEE